MHRRGYIYSHAVAKLAHIAMKFDIRLFELMNTQYTTNTKCVNARLALHYMLCRKASQSHVATLSDLHDVGAYIHVTTKLTTVFMSACCLL